MQIANLPVSFPCIFWIIACAWSIFQGYAGFRYGLYIYDLAQNSSTPNQFVRFTAYGLHHGAFYCLCSLSGFTAWRFLIVLSEKVINWSEISGGTGAVLISLAVISVVGVSGGLPRILFLGNRPL